MNKLTYRLLLTTVIVTHHLALWIIVISIPLLFYYEPIWISLPLCSWIMHLGLNGLDCPYTRLENYLRKKLYLPEIKYFISHYYKKPYNRLMWKIEEFNRG